MSRFSDLFQEKQIKEEVFSVPVNDEKIELSSPSSEVELVEITSPEKVSEEVEVFSIEVNSNKSSHSWRKR